MQCTAVFRKVPGGYIAFVEEFPGANTQGASLEEARTNLREAVAMVVEANHVMAQEDASAGAVISDRTESIGPARVDSVGVRIVLNTATAPASSGVANTWATCSRGSRRYRSPGRVTWSS